MTTQLSASETRIMRFLKNGDCEVQDSVRASHVLLATEQGTIAASRTELEAMQKGDYCIGRRSGLFYRSPPTGR